MFFKKKKEKEEWIKGIPITSANVPMPEIKPSKELNLIEKEGTNVDAQENIEEYIEK